MMICTGCQNVFIPTEEGMKAHAKCVLEAYERQKKQWERRREGEEREKQQDREREARRKAQEEAEQRWREQEYQRQHQRVYEEFNQRFYEEFNQRFWGSGSTKTTNTASHGGLTKDRVMKLLRLCHPDLHNNSEMATEMTRWLIEQKEKLED